MGDGGGMTNFNWNVTGIVSKSDEYTCKSKQTKACGLLVTLKAKFHILKYKRHLKKAGTYA